MMRRIITDEELISATALVRESMLRTLPEPEDCGGEFTAQFEEKIRKLKKTAERKADWRRFAKGAIAAVIVVIIGSSMLFAFNTEVRAAVTGWFKEIFEAYTTYWFPNIEEEMALPKYELTWVPDGYIVVIDEVMTDSRIMLYQAEENELDGFTLNFSMPQSDSPVKVEFLGMPYSVEQVWINDCSGDLYISQNPTESHCLIWSDENNKVVFAITSYISPEDILRIAEGVKLVE